jgi:transcriptional regulator with XRE-family HTH domain
MGGRAPSPCAGRAMRWLALHRPPVAPARTAPAIASRVRPRYVPNNRGVCRNRETSGVDPLQQFGTRFRAVRVKRGWRQQDVAIRAGVHRTVVSNIERGHLAAMSIGTILAVARSLDIQVSLTARWHAADLDRLVNSRHARLHESVAQWFGSALPEWVLDPEVTFSIYGERGTIDILAWHPRDRALIVIELKTDIVDVNQLMGQMNQRRRLARQIARDRGWDPVTISTWVIVANGRTNRARLAAHRAVLRNAFPLDGRSMQGWLRRPDRSVAALSLWERGEHGAANADLAARHRVRVPGRRRSTGTGPGPRGGGVIGSPAGGDGSPHGPTISGRDRRDEPRTMRNATEGDPMADRPRTRAA